MCVLQQVAWTVVLVRTVATDRMETMAKMARMVAMVRHNLSTYILSHMPSMLTDN
jgi:hypothetical protein